MQEINENSTYDEAFNVSKKMIKLAWKNFSAKDKYEYDDFYQNCAMYFYGELKNKFSPFDACNICSKAYHFIALNMLKKIKRKQDILAEDKWINNVPDKQCNLEQQIENKQWLESNPLNLKDVDWTICKLLMDGYDRFSIAEILGYTPNTIQFHMTEIRKKAAKYFDIDDYSKKYRTYQWREESKTRICGKNNPKSKKVLCLKDGVAIKTYGSMREAARELGLTPSGASIYSAIKNGYKSGGYEWKYA